MHILDLLMYFATCGIIWFLLEKLSNGELTHEYEFGMVGMFIIFVWTIIYVILFWFCDYNWIDIFHNIKLPTFQL